MAQSDSVSPFFGGMDPAVDEAVNLSLETSDDETGSVEGEIAVDVFQTDNHVVIVSPIAGVAPDDIEISYTDDSLTISGERQSSHTTEDHHVVTQEIYWGSFERTIHLPIPCVVDKTVATCEHGVLTLKVPKASKAKKGVIKVKTNASKSAK